MPFLHVTSHVEGRKDDGLLREKTGREVFPTILFLDAEGDLLLSLDRAVLSGAISTGRFSIASLGRKLEACEDYLALRARVAAGDASAKVPLAVRALEIGRIDDAEFGKATAGHEFAPEDAKRIAKVRANATCESLVAKVRASGMDPEVEKAVLREFLKLYEKGAHPDSESADIYWWEIATHAKAEGDAAMVERSLEGLLATGGRERFGPLVDEMEARLAKLRPN